MPGLDLQAHFDLRVQDRYILNLLARRGDEVAKGYFTFCCVLFAFILSFVLLAIFENKY